MIEIVIVIQMKDRKPSPRTKKSIKTKCDSKFFPLNSVEKFDLTEL